MHDLCATLDKTVQKTEVLCHVVDGFLIEESLSPFPNTLTSLTCDELNSLHKRQQEMIAQENHIENNDNFGESVQVDEDKTCAICEFCGVSGTKNSFLSPSRRFCTLSCARRFATSHSKRRRGSNQLHLSKLKAARAKPYRKSVVHQNPKCSVGDSFKLRKSLSNSTHQSASDSSFSDFIDSASSNDESVYSFELSSSPEPAVPFSGSASLQPVRWSVDDVWKYIRSLPDSCQYAEEFRSQEIDGSALLLLHEEHLITSMNLPLGPALKLCAHIDRLRLQDT